MKKYEVALSFYVEESADNLEEAKTTALNKVRYKGGILYELEAVGIHADEDWRETTITEEDKG
tara:strand:+ start:336 stop:524 length:189 start_codon:yes stop_codon:yes gene_type:complete